MDIAWPGPTGLIFTLAKPWTPLLEPWIPLLELHSDLGLVGSSSRPGQITPELYSFSVHVHTASLDCMLHISANSSSFLMGANSASTVTVEEPGILILESTPPTLKWSHN